MYASAFTQVLTGSESPRFASGLELTCTSVLQAKLVGRTGSREIGMLIMADIVDFIELTFAMRGHGCNSCNNVTLCQFTPSKSTQDAIIVCHELAAPIPLVLTNYPPFVGVHFHLHPGDYICDSEGRHGWAEVCQRAGAGSPSPLSYHMYSVRHFSLSVLFLWAVFRYIRRS